MDNLEFKLCDDSGNLVACGSTGSYWVIPDREGATLELHKGDRAGPNVKPMGHYSSVELAKRAANVFEG